MSATALPDNQRQWWEITVQGHPALDELITWRLRDGGCQGTASQVQNQGLTVQAYLNPGQFQEADLTDMAAQLQADVRFMALGQLTIDWHLVPEQDWAKNWQDHWHPQEIGERLLINPAWLPLPSPPGRQVIQLNPGVAFGTGTHATTQLCLRALEGWFADSLEPPAAIADIGCGSGILSIAAVLLGADRAYAVDTDPLAVDSARESRDLNGIAADRLVVELGSCDRISPLLPTPVDGFICNILADVIVTLIPQFRPLIKPKGWGLLSGILTRQIPQMTEKLTQYGWQITATDTQGDWCCLHIQST